MKLLTPLTLAACFFLSHAAIAEQQPLKLASDKRIEVVAYAPYNVVPIEGTTFTTTQIIFGQHEVIENIQNGDLGAWTASVDPHLPYMLFVKPTVYGSHTNMTIVTNKHTYYFNLVSSAQGSNASEIKAQQAGATYAIRFMYPLDVKRKVEAAMLRHLHQKQAEISAFKNPESYHWDYSFHGDRRVVPMHVFDDGKFTYLQLQPGQDVPAVFAVLNPDGKESVVNFRQDGRYLVIQRVVPQLTLRVGKAQVASIFNNKRVATLQDHHFFS